MYHKTNEGTIFQGVLVFFLCNCCRTKFSSLRLFLTGEILSIALLMKPVIFFHREILSFLLLIGYVNNQCKLYSRKVYVHKSQYL